MKTIYNTYVVMESQEQCDRMKQLCIDNGLKVDDTDTFLWRYCYPCIFEATDEEFYIPIEYIKTNQNKVTEQEFIKLLKNTKL